MSVHATILILDGISTNRIMLKVQLSAAWYRVVQGDRLEGILPMIRRCQPDLIVTSMTLPDGDAMDLVELLRGNDIAAGIPVIAIAPQNDGRARLRALAAGVDDVLSQPVDDLMLQARIRSLLRARSNHEELQIPGPLNGQNGVAEQASVFDIPSDGGSETSLDGDHPLSPLEPAHVALLTSDARVGAQWRIQLGRACPHQIRSLKLSEANQLMSKPVPDAIVIALGGDDSDKGLRLLADLRARAASRNAALIALVDPANNSLAAEALDRGAHDVIANGFCANELSLRLDTQLRIRARSERLRTHVRDGLRAALRDPMTGLYNRRYAMPRLARTVHCAMNDGAAFAVMLADLDHFKCINDHYGHLTGDAVLIETARRMQNHLGAAGMIARVGGEEFMILLPSANAAEATTAADNLCRLMNETPFTVAGAPAPIKVTVSIGVALGPGSSVPGMSDEAIAADLYDRADRALYSAKGAGRNQVTVQTNAA